MKRNLQKTVAAARPVCPRWGAVLPIVAVFVVILLAMAAFSIDIAYIELVKTELRGCHRLGCESRDVCIGSGSIRIAGPNGGDQYGGDEQCRGQATAPIDLRRCSGKVGPSVRWNVAFCSGSSALSSGSDFRQHVEFERERDGSAVLRAVHGCEFVLSDERFCRVSLCHGNLPGSRPVPLDDLGSNRNSRKLSAADLFERHLGDPVASGERQPLGGTRFGDQFVLQHPVELKVPTPSRGCHLGVRTSG